MLAILNSKPIYDKSGRVVHGRFYVFQKDTDQKAKIYLYDENNSLIQGANPVYTDNYGYPEYDVILDDNIYSIVVESYIGNYSDPKQDERPEMWEISNTYYEGYVKNSDETPEVVYGINSLADADIAKQKIDVVGYYNPFDCGLRTYVWDPDCLAMPDGGYVLGSNKESTGRWILLNDLPWIPSEYYGVYPGKTSNMNNLVSAPKYINGSAHVYSLPNAIKFATGEYELPTNMVLAFDRSLVVDNKTSFGTKYTVTCNGVTRFGERTNTSIGKLKLPSTTPARLSWFPDYDSFLDCGAKSLHIDCDLPSIYLTGTHTMENCTFYFEGYNFQTMGGSLTLDNCSIEGATSNNNGFSSDVVFKNMYYTDKYMWSGSNANVIQNCTFNVLDFKSIDNYVEAVIKTGGNTLDLAGKTATKKFTIPDSVSAFYLSNGDFKNVEVGFTGSTIKNVIIQKANVNFTKLSGKETLQLTDCHVYTPTETKAFAITSSNSTITNCTVLDSLWLEKTYVTGNTTVGTTSGRNSTITATQCNLAGEVIGKTISIRQSMCGLSVKGYDTIYMDNVSVGGEVYMYGTGSVSIHNSICNDKVTAYRLGLIATTVNGECRGFITDVVNCNFMGGLWCSEFYNESTARLEIVANITGCTFHGPNAGITLKTLSSSVNQVILNGFYVNGNTFLQSGNHDGISLQVFNGEERYIHDDPTLHRWSWEGNSGNCLQPYWIGSKSLTQGIHQLDGIRFIFFGINGYTVGNTPKIIPMEMEMTLVENKTTATTTSKYLFGIGNWNVPNCYYMQYSITDYFTFRFNNTNTAQNATYNIVVRPMRRYTETNQIL